MKKLLPVLLLFSGLLEAQTITGTVRDEKQEPVIGATVLLMADTIMIQGNLSDSLGKFRFSGLHDNRAYYLKISIIGYAGALTDTVKPPYEFKSILLKEDEDNALQEVVVKGKKPMFETQLDRTIVNVDAMPGGNTGNAYSLLEKTPGVSVVNKDISLNGKQNVSVMINGRPSHLSGQDLENYLKSLSAGDIEKIELIENPPAKYDAAGGAVINLKLKASREAGWSGNVNLNHNVGRHWRNYDGVSLSYYAGKVYSYVSGGYSNERYRDYELRQTHFLRENYRVEQESQSVTHSKGFNYHAGADYFLSERTTVGIFYRNSQPNVPGYRTMENREPNNPVTTITTNREKKTYDGASAYLTQKWGKKEFSLELNQVRYRNDAVLNNVNVGREEFQYVIAPRIRTRSAALDYVQPIRRGKIEAGVKTTAMDNDNLNIYQDVISNTAGTDWGKSNHFQYHEKIHAAYIDGQYQLKRLSFKAGIRIETTRAEGIQLGNEVIPKSGFKRNYTNAFHHFTLHYKLDSAGKKTLSFVTQRRLSRPYYLYLNPFMQYSDEYNYTTGNPELNPQIQDRYELTFRSDNKWSAGININPFKDVILLTTQTIDNVFYTKRDNIAKGYMYMLNLGLNTQIAPWWTANYTARLAHIGLRGTLYVENLDYSINLLRGELSNHFKVNNSLSLLNYINYTTRDYNGQTVIKGRIMVNLGLQYKFMKDKASVNLSADDIFYTWKSRSFSTNITNAFITSLSYSDTRRVGLSLSYRLGNNKNQKRGKSGNASDDRM